MYAKSGQLDQRSRSTIAMRNITDDRNNGGGGNASSATIVSDTLTTSSYDPAVFGPAFWFTLHNGATTYPTMPTDYVRNGMRQLLINLPLLVPCLVCREHFYEYLRDCKLDKAVESRENLFAFIVGVHNFVNVRYGKLPMTLAEAKRIYGFDAPGRGTRVRVQYVAVSDGGVS